MYKNRSDVFNVKGNGKNYSVGDIIQIAGEKGKVKWKKSSRTLFTQTEMWNDILEQDERLACVEMWNGKEIYLVF